MQVLLLLPEQSGHRVPGDVCFEALDQTGSRAVDAAGKIASGVFPLLLASPNSPPDSGVKPGFVVEIL